MKTLKLYFGVNDRVNLEAKGFTDSIEDLEEIFYILSSGTRMIVTKIEELRGDLNK